MSASSSRTFSIAPAAKVSAGSRSYIVEAVLSAETALLQLVDDGTFHTLPLTDLRPDEEATDRPAAAQQHARLDLVADAAKHEVAQKRLAAIQPLLTDFRRPRSEVEKVARDMGVATSTVYEWISRYQDSPQPSSLIPSTRGPKPGFTKVDDRVEAIVKGAIKRNLLVKQRKRVTIVYDEIKDDCRAAGLVPPHINTVRARVQAIPRRIILRAQGRGDEANDEFEPRLGKLPDAKHPLAVVQMDHSRANVMIVDDITRKSIGRPWITLAMDVYSRMIVGMVVSLEAPSAFAAGRCIANAILPKAEQMAALGITGEWPCYGIPKMIHLDNAKEFRGETLRTAIRENRSDVRFRPVKTPHYGGHIERMMRTVLEAMNTLPGATFSNPTERSGYDSDKEAAMTLAEFEKWLFDFVINQYHCTPHRGIGRATPLSMWHKGMRGDEISGPAPVRLMSADPERLRLDFLPFVWRTVGRRGFVVDYMNYWTDTLRHRIGEPDPEARKHKRKFLLRIDPRDITKIWYLDPNTKEYVMTQCADMTRPAVSRWEWKFLQRHAVEEGLKGIDEDKLFETRRRLHAQIESAIKQTKTIRRIQQRAESTRKHALRDAGSKKTVNDNGPVIDRNPGKHDAGGHDGFMDGPVSPYDDLQA